MERKFGVVPVKIKKLSEFATIPYYAKDGDSGFDLRASETVTIAPGATVVVPTGLAMAIPVGLELQVRPRSGVALKGKLIVKNSPGTIDSGYRGDIGIILYNYDSEPAVIDRGTRIAQAVLCPVLHAGFEEVDDLDETDRGAGGYGHTGLY